MVVLWRYSLAAPAFQRLLKDPLVKIFWDNLFLLCSLENSRSELKQQLENHRSEAAQSHEYYIEVTKHCSQQWDRITKKLSICC